MKRFLSALLSVLIAAGSTMPSVYAAENEMPQQYESGYEDSGLFPEVIHISGDKLKGMVEEYDGEHPDEAGEESADDGELSPYASDSPVGVFADEEAPDILGEEFTEAPIRAYADTNTYTEYVYIRSAADLLAIDGHDGGYYELAADIDLKGMEWPGIALTNAVFDGKGHYIYNLTQTNEHSTGLFSNIADKDANVYIANVNLSDININITQCTGGDVAVTVLGSGGITPENCYASGKISTNVTAKSLGIYVFANGINCDSRVNINVGGSPADSYGYWYVYNMVQCRHSGYEGDIKITGTHDHTRVYGLYGCTDKSVFYGDITLNADIVEEAYVDLNGLFNCDDAAFKGNIESRPVFKGSGGMVSAQGLSGGKDCDFTGDVSTYSSGDTRGIPNASAGAGTNCTFTGDVSVYTNGQWNGFVMGISGDSSTMTGDIYANVNIDGSGHAPFDVYGIGRGKNCVLNGNITGKGANVLVTPIHDYAENCVVNGDSTSTYRIHGIYNGCKNCTINGNLSGVGDIYGNTAGISNGSTDCTINGFISVQKGDIYGIMGGSGNTVNGDVMTQNGKGYGIDTSTGSYISGMISEKQGYEPLSVTAASPYMGYFECQGCHQKVVNARDLTDEVHCTKVSSSGSISEYKYKKIYEMKYSIGTGEATDNGEPLEFPPDREKFPYTIKLVSTESGEVIPNAVITIDGKEYKTDENGIISVSEGETNVMLTVKIDGNIMLVNRNFYPVKNRENIVEVCEIAVDVDLGESDEAPGNPPTGNFNGKKFSMFDLPASVSLPKVGNMQMTYDKNRKAYRILFGDLKGIKNTGKDFNRLFIGVQNLVTNAKNGLFSDKDFMKLVNTPQKGALGFSGSGNVVGYIELQKTKDDTVATGAVLMKYTARAENTIPFAAAPVFFVTYGVTGTLEAGITLTMSTTNMVNKSFEPHGMVAMSVTPNVGLGIGMKKFASAEVGFDAILRGQITYPFRSVQQDVSAWLTGEFYILGSIMGFEGRTAWTLGRWKLYPLESGVKTAGDEVITFNADEMTLADRSYLKNKTQDTREGTIKSNIYPYSSVKFGSVGSKRMMVWLDDDPTRDDLNRTAVYYSIKNDDGTWTEPKQVHDDGTADYQFDLFSNGGLTYIVWQNAVGKVTGNSPDEIAPKVDLYYSEIGQYVGKYDWEEPKAITTNNSDYEYDPKIAADRSYGQYIIWKQNDKNTPLAGYVDVKESIYKVHKGYSTMEPVEKAAENLPYVYSMDVSATGNVAFVTDSDNDITTAGSTLYCKGTYTDSSNTEHKIDESYSSESDITGLMHGSANFFFMEDSTLKTMNANGIVTDVHSFDTEVTNPVILTGGTDSVSSVLYEVPNGFDTSVYYAKLYYYTGWSEPLFAGSFDEKVRSWDVIESKETEIAAVMADIDVKNDYNAESLPENTIKANEIKETVRLAYTTIKPVEDISALYLDCTDDIKPGCGASFEVGVKNDTIRALEKMHLKLTDDKGNVLFDKDCYPKVSSGGTDTLYASATIPEDFTRGTITAEVSVENLEESDRANNLVSETYGGTDLELKVRANSIHRTGCVDVNVRNNGSIAAKNAVISIKNEAGDVIAKQTVSEILSSVSEKVSIPVPETYSRPKEKIKIYAEVVSDDELNDYDNAGFVEIEEYIDEAGDSSKFVFGDADGNGKVEAGDATYILQKALVSTFELPLQKKTNDWMRYADVDGNGKIEAGDATFVLQKALVSTFELPVEKLK